MKETLKKERSESHNLKRKYEDMIDEVEISKEECHTLQADKDALIIYAGNIENNSQTTMPELVKLQQKYQSLEVERDELRLSVEELDKEKGRLEGKVTELEEQKTTVEGKAKLYETQIAALEDQKNLLAASLKSSMEQKVDI